MMKNESEREERILYDKTGRRALNDRRGSV